MTKASVSIGASLGAPPGDSQADGRTNPNQGPAGNVQFSKVPAGLSLSNCSGTVTLKLPGYEWLVMIVVDDVPLWKGEFKWSLGEVAPPTYMIEVPIPIGWNPISEVWVNYGVTNFTIMDSTGPAGGAAAMEYQFVLT